MHNRPSDLQKRIWFNALTIFSVTIIGTLLVGGIWLSGEVLAYLQPVLVPLAVAGILAYLIDPVVVWMERKGLSRLGAIITFFIVSIIAFSGFLFLAGKPMKQQFESLSHKTPEYITGAKKMIREFGQIESVANAFPFLNTDAQVEKVLTQQEERVESEVEQTEQETVIVPEIVSTESNSLTIETDAFDWMALLSVDKLMNAAQEYAPTLAKRLTEVVTRGASKFFGFLGYLLGFVMVPIYLFFFLKESDKIKRNWRDVVPLRTSTLKDEVVTTLTEINDYLIAFFRGQVLVSLIDGLLVGIALVIFQHPYGILLGIALAFLGIIPFIGNVICLVPASVTAYTHFSIAENQYWGIENPWIYVVIVIGLFLVVQQINSLVTAPKIVGDSVGLHPMTVIFSMLFWSLLLGGFLGALLAVPMTASVKVLFKRYIWERKVMSPELSPSS